MREKKNTRLSKGISDKLPIHLLNSRNRKEDHFSNNYKWNNHIIQLPTDPNWAPTLRQKRQFFSSMYLINYLFTPLLFYILQIGSLTHTTDKINIPQPPSTPHLKKDNQEPIFWDKWKERHFFFQWVSDKLPIHLPNSTNRKYVHFFHKHNSILNVIPQVGSR